MQVFLVERDLDGISMADLSGTQQAAIRQAAAMRREGDGVRYLRSFFVPDDGRCLCLFEAKNATVVAELNLRARLPYTRIIAAIEVLSLPMMPDRTPNMLGISGELCPDEGWLG